MLPYSSFHNLTIYLLSYRLTQDKCDASANTVLDPLTEWTWEFCNEVSVV